MNERGRGGAAATTPGGSGGSRGMGGRRPTLQIPPATIAAEKMSTWGFFSRGRGDPRMHFIEAPCWTIYSLSHKISTLTAVQTKSGRLPAARGRTADCRIERESPHSWERGVEITGSQDWQALLSRFTL